MTILQGNKAELIQAFRDCAAQQGLSLPAAAERAGLKWPTCHHVLTSGSDMRLSTAIRVLRFIGTSNSELAAQIAGKWCSQAQA